MKGSESSERQGLQHDEDDDDQWRWGGVSL